MPKPRNRRPVAVAITPSGGQWVAFVTVAAGDRRKRSSAMCASCKVEPRVGCECYQRCEDKVRELEEDRDNARVTKAGRVPTVAAYLQAWVDEGERNERWAYNTVVDYRKMARLYLVPHLGRIRLDELTVEHVKAMQAAVRDSVSANAAVKAHRTLRAALADAVRGELLARNVVRLVKPPTLRTVEVQPLTVDEAARILVEAGKLRNGARWWVALLLGLRQGETLALAWRRPLQPRLGTDVDLDAGTLTVREKVYRRKWRHGCADAAACAQARCKARPCPDPCGRHKRTCPPPCAPGCTSHASTCPQRADGGLALGRPKSRAGERTVPLPAPVWEALRAHKVRQDAEREEMGELWTDTGRVFTTETGGLIDARRDWGQWCAILDAAGVPHARVHDARHTAATFHLAMNTDRRVVMDLMGWSQVSMASRYQHPTAEVLREAANRIGSLLPGSDGNATDHATATGATVLQFRPRAV